MDKEEKQWKTHKNVHKNQTYPYKVHWVVSTAHRMLHSALGLYATTELPPFRRVRFLFNFLISSKSYLE